MDASAADVRGTGADLALAEGDSLPSLTAGDVEFVDVLRSALASDPAAASRPGQLRQRLEACLGADETTRLRPLVHQVVAAAEENLPGYLTRIMPLTPQSLQQLSGELATARGWNDGTAQRVTQIWAHALGFSGVVADWPQEAPTPSRSPSTAAEVPGPRLPVVGATAMPPSRVVPAEVGAWPATRSSLTKRHPTSSGGEPVLGAVRAYAGMALQVYVLVVGVFVLLMLAGFVVLHLVVGVIPVLLVVYGMRRWLGGGVLVATATGLEFTPYSVFGSKPKSDGAFSAPWTEVSVDEGAVSVLRLAGRKTQVGPFSRQFARAASGHAGRGV